MERVDRNDSDLIQSLKDELDKLQNFYNKVYAENDKKYLGNIASQLRILVIRTKMNHPLLLDILKKYKIKISIKRNVPSNHPKYGEKESLEKYLEHKIIPAIRGTKSGNLLSLTYRELIKKYSEQFGGAHQDPKVTEDIHAVKEARIPFFNIESDKLSFESVSKTVLEVGYECIDQVKMKKEFKINYQFSSLKLPKISDYVRIIIDEQCLIERILKIQFQILNPYLLGKEFEMKIFDPNKNIWAHYEHRIPNAKTWTVPFDKKDKNGKITSFSKKGKYTICLTSKGMESTELFFNL